MDTLSPSSATATFKTTDGNDTFRAATSGDLTTADYIDGGAGTDTLKFTDAAVATASIVVRAPELKNVEIVNVTSDGTALAAAGGSTFSGVNSTGIQQVWLVNSINNATEQNTVTVNNISKSVTVGIEGGSNSVAASAIRANNTFAFNDVTGTADAATLALKGAQANNVTLAGVETLNISVQGTTANTLAILSAANATTVNVTGAAGMTISASDLAAIVTVNASTSTGAISFTGETAATSTTFIGGTGNTTVTTASTGVINVTTGAGNDTVNISGSANTAAINTGAGNDKVMVGASTNVTAADVIVGGDGTDTIVVSDATINATTKTTLALGVSGFEILETTATTGVSVDFNALSTYDTVRVSGISAVVAAAVNTAGTAGVNAITFENTDALVVAAAITGGAGGLSFAGGADVGGAGASGIVLTPKLDNGTNAATVTFIGNADVIGGAGGASVEAADTGGAGGKALDASLIETLNLVISGTQLLAANVDTVTFGAAAGGAAGGGTAGAAGSSVTVGANATINVTSILDAGTTGAVVNNHLDLGTVIGSNVTINASAFAGNLTVTAATGNVTISGGLGNDTITGGAGTDTINGGAGNDTLNGMAGADVYTGGAGRDSFAISTSGTTAFDTVSDFGKVTTALSTTQVGTMSLSNAFGAGTDVAHTLGGAVADILSFATTSTFATAASGTDVATVSDNAGKAITGSISAKGLITLAGANVALVDTLVEWVGIANALVTVAGNDAMFEFGGSTYVFQQNGATDSLVQLIGVTGVTGGVVAGSSVVAAVGDIFVA